MYNMYVHWTEISVIIQECNDIPNDDTSQYFIDDTRRLSYDIDATVRLGAPCDIGDIVSTDYFFSTKNLKSMK